MVTTRGLGQKEAIKLAMKGKNPVKARYRDILLRFPFPLLFEPEHVAKAQKRDKPNSSYWNYFGHNCGQAWGMEVIESDI